MNDAIFIDNSIEVKEALEKYAEKWLTEAATMIESQVKQNTAVDSSQTKQNWKHVVDIANHEAVVGNPLENAIWEEFGTGEYALNGNGRKGGWFYTDENNIGHFTYGKHPRRPLYRAFEIKKSHLINLAKKFFREDFK